MKPEKEHSDQKLEISKWTDKEFTGRSYSDFGFAIMDFRSADDELLAIVRRTKERDDNHPYPYEYELLDGYLNRINTSHDVNEIMRSKSNYIEITNELRNLRNRRPPNLRLER